MIVSDQTHTIKKPWPLRSVYFFAAAQFIIYVLTWVALTVWVHKIPDGGLLCSGENLGNMTRFECGALSAIINKVPLADGSMVIPPLVDPSGFSSELLGRLAVGLVFLYLLIQSIRKRRRKQYCVWSVLYTLYVSFSLHSMPLLGLFALFILCIKSTRNYFTLNQPKNAS